MVFSFPSTLCMFLGGIRGKGFSFLSHFLYLSVHSSESLLFPLSLNKSSEQLYSSGHSEGHSCKGQIDIYSSLREGILRKKVHWQLSYPTRMTVNVDRAAKRWTKMDSTHIEWVSRENLITPQLEVHQSERETSWHAKRWGRRRRRRWQGRERWDEG